VGPLPSVRVPNSALIRLHVLTLTHRWLIPRYIAGRCASSRVLTSFETELLSSVSASGSGSRTKLQLPSRCPPRLRCEFPVA
jgi:hypothetical protein